MTAEEERLEAARTGSALWRRWGPYLSERQWGTVREDYSADGTAWEYFPHEMARSRAYRWGEDGIAGLSDDHQHLCFALALWNGKDEILKERLFGLTTHQGNHGEDVKEYYFYLDNVPTHAYMKMLYKYPQGAFPYADLVRENGRRTRRDPEYELIDTGIFNDDRYFDVFVSYAKASPEDILIHIEAWNRGPEAAELHLLPTLWLRNTWSWAPGGVKPLIAVDRPSPLRLKVSEPHLGTRWLYASNDVEPIFTENETNQERLFKVPNPSPYVKDSFHAYVIKGERDRVNPEKRGTKAALYCKKTLQPGEKWEMKLRLSDSSSVVDPLGSAFDEIVALRLQEADAFYHKVTPFEIPSDMRNIQRQAFAGLLWNKQYYRYKVKEWLKGDPNEPVPPASREKGRNHHWWNVNASEILSMPDKWEYPWFAAWDLGFHAVTLAMIDPELAKRQLILLTKEWYMHPSGQIPAYEWAFGDANPPVQAWAAMRVYQIERARYGREDRDFLEQMFQKLTMNFTWWVNRKDAGGRNIFEGGFLGLDNIGAFDRALGPPSGGMLEQPDGTGWMGMYCLNLQQMALELAIKDPVYEEMATKFFEHFVYIADAINSVDGKTEGLWDADAGFYFGLLRMPDGTRVEMAEESMVGVVPIFAVATNEPTAIHPFLNYRRRFRWFVENSPELLHSIGDLSKLEGDGHLLISLVDPQKLVALLEKLLDERQFLSPHGVRSVSKKHAIAPFVLELGGREFKLDYEPAESTTPLFGGNSNWRGPVWFPLNYLLLESLQKFHYFLGNEFKVEFPTGSGKKVSLWEVTTGLTYRLLTIFLKDKEGRRPLYGGTEKFQTDPHWRDYILFYEYFHGDNGAGLGASHQTGWTAIVAKLIHQYGAYVLHGASPQVIEKEKVGHV